MSRLRTSLTRLRGLFRKERMDLELAEELASHLEMHIEDKVRAGMTAEEARRDALIKLGGIEQTKENCRDQRGWPFLESLLQDLRFGLRMLRNNPGFSVTAVLTMMLGIGANTAIFSVVSAALLRPLPYPDSQQLVSISDTVQGMRNWPSTYLNYLDWKRQNRVFESIAAYQGDSYNLWHSSSVDRVRAWNVSAEFFRALKVKPMFGRDFEPNDDRPGAPPVVQLTYGLWQRWFGAEPAVVGQTVDISGRSFMIIGVLPENFRFYEDAGLYTPLGLSADQMQGRRNHSVRVIARLNTGVSIKQAQANMTAIADNLAEQYPAANAGTTVDVVGLQQYVVQDTKLALSVLMWAVLFLLLIACVNVANLLLARGAARGREMAVRTALGAKWSRVLRQLLTESVTLSVVAGSLAVPFCLWGMSALQSLLPEDRRELLKVTLDARVLAITLLCSILTGILFGLAPALRARRMNLVVALKAGARTTNSQIDSRFRSLLMVAEIALALMLVSAAGLMLRSVHNLLHVDPGFDVSHILTMHVNLADANYGKPIKQTEYAGDILRRINTLPGVEASAVATWLPFRREAWLDAIYIEGQPMPAEGRFPQVHYNVVSSEYFRTLRIPLVKGRYFTSADTAQATRVAIISRTMAKRFWPNDDPIGRRFTEGKPQDTNSWRTVVGIAGDTRIDSLDEDIASQFYLPFPQNPNDYFTVAVRTAADPLTLAGPIQQELGRVDKGQPPYDIVTVQETLSESLTPKRIVMTLLTAFAVLAIVLASVGVYGVTFYLTSRRLQEIGIRIALGASRNDILRLLLVRGLALSAAGLTIGVAGSLFLTRFLVTFLHGVRPADPSTLAVTTALVFFVALLAASVPAYRATKIDAMVAVRYE